MSCFEAVYAATDQIGSGSVVTRMEDCIVVTTFFAVYMRWIDLENLKSDF